MIMNKFNYLNRRVEIDLDLGNGENFIIYFTFSPRTWKKLGKASLLAYILHLASGR